MSDSDLVLQSLIWLLLVLIVYHHLGYPLMLKYFAAHQQSGNDLLPYERGFKNSTLDNYLPHIHLVVPAFNEETVIRQKIDSIAWLDYPKDKLTISILCDGCSDATVREAVQAHQRFMNNSENVHIHNFSVNRGKIAMVNMAINSTKQDILAFSDASSVLAVDVLWRTARHFMRDRKLGVVTGDYKLLVSGSEGESAYWNYQNKVRDWESSLGACMGAPGAFYAIRSELCSELEFDTINDDFILPMRAVSAGYTAKFDRNIHIYESEPSSLEDDAQRRNRISQGNLQQLLRLYPLLVPGIGKHSSAVSWMFFSGKGLRVIMPYLLLVLLFTTAWLAPTHWFYGLLFAGQVSVYLMTCAAALGQFENSLLSRIFASRAVKVISYLCQGHFMGLLGTARYIGNKFIKSKSQRSW